MEHNRLTTANTAMREQGLNTISRLKIRENEARMRTLLENAVGRGGSGRKANAR